MSVCRTQACPTQALDSTAHAHASSLSPVSEEDQQGRAISVTARRRQRTVRLAKTGNVSEARGSAKPRDLIWSLSRPKCLRLLSPEPPDTLSASLDPPNTDHPSRVPPPTDVAQTRPL